MFSPHLFFFPSHLLARHLPSCKLHNFPQVFPSTKLSSINHDSHLHLSGFSTLRKILTIDHYLRNQDFQQFRSTLEPSDHLWLRVVILVLFFLLHWICFVGLWAGIYMDQMVVCLEQYKFMRLSTFESPHFVISSCFPGVAYDYCSLHLEPILWSSTRT